MSKSLSFLVLAFLMSSSVPASAQFAQPLQAAPSPPVEGLRPVILVAAHGEIGLASARRDYFAYGPTGFVRAFVGHEVSADPGLRLSLGYEGSLGFGPDSLESNDPGAMLLTRHGVGLGIQMGVMVSTVSIGVAALHLIDHDATLAGGTLQAQTGVSVDGFFLAFAVGGDLFPSAGMVAVTAGLSIGWSTF